MEMYLNNSELPLSRERVVGLTGRPNGNEVVISLFRTTFVAQAILGNALLGNVGSTTYSLTDGTSELATFKAWLIGASYVGDMLELKLMVDGLVTYTRSRNDNEHKVNWQQEGF